ncbi:MULTISPECIES: hypothetical protein [unclassified Microbacterium]|uniref:hypothetical protein n=1 Tax=unclassified Microbacterium TaxID=2609290 RepID=UPI00301744F4
MSTDRNQVLSLHKYFLNASQMKRHYEDRGRAHGLASSPADDDWTFQWIYLSLWYASLFVVAEGWQEARMRNERVSELLADSEKLGALRRFRNGIFHFQADYFDARIVDFLALGAESALWAHELHAALGSDLLSRLRSAH